MVRRATSAVLSISWQCQWSSFSRPGSLSTGSEEARPASLNAVTTITRADVVSKGRGSEGNPIETVAHIPLPSFRGLLACARALTHTHGGLPLSTDYLHVRAL